MDELGVLEEGVKRERLTGPKTEGGEKVMLEAERVRRGHLQHLQLR